MKAPGVYLIRNAVSGRVYVGSSSLISSRWKAHRDMLTHGTHHSPTLQRSWEKHGEAAFEFSVLEVVKDERRLLAREQYWMDELEAADPQKGFNVAPVAGTRRGVPQPPSVARKLRKFFTGVPKSAEHRAKIGAGNRGKVRTEDTKQRISKAVKKLMRTPEARAQAAVWGAQAEGFRGHSHTEETKQALREAALKRLATRKGKATQLKAALAGGAVAKDKPGYWTGKKFSAEACARMSAAHLGKPNPSASRPKSDEWRRNHSAKLKLNWAARKAQALQPN